MPKVMPSFQINAKILYNKRTKKDYYEMGLLAAQIAESALPGQFVNIKVSDGLEPLLRRPLSIHRIEKSGIKILYEVVGKGTQLLTHKKAGEYLDIIGPLGNGFDLRSMSYDLRPILVSGGMGSAPLVFLAEKLMELRRTQYAVRNTVLIGARTKEDILCEEEFRDLGCEIKIATDNGSRGFNGRVTDLLQQVLRFAIRDSRFAIYACGPTPMLKEISRISREYKVPAQISLEAHMACGIGVCMGCVVRTADDGFKYKRVCKEGPVFEASEIVW